jgi:hypothetical protein
MAPILLDSSVGNKSVDGHDWRSDFDWIMRQGFNWVISDTADVWAAELERQGKRNIHRMLRNGTAWKDGKVNGWYKRRWSVAE